MDFVKREDQNVIDEENYKVYMESLQKSHQIDTEYQHTPISMEQLHQAMQSSLNAGTLVHNFQLPLSPRQMSTLMLKTNHISRNLNFNEIPAHLSRNLSSEMDLMHNLSNELPRHDDIIIGQNLSRNLDISLVRNMGNELDMTNGLAQTLAQNLSEQDLARNLSSDMSIAQNLRVELPHDLSHEIDLSHHSNILSQEDRRTPLILADNIIEHNMAQNLAHRLDQTLAQRLDQTLAQRLDQTLAQRLDQTLAQRLDANGAQTLVQRLEQNGVQRLDQRLLNSSIMHDNMKLEQGDNFLPMPFHIKSEQDDSYFYENINPGLDTVNGLNGHIHTEHNSAQPVHQDNQMFSVYGHASVPALNPIHNYIQNYVTNNISRDNPQNLVVHKQFENVTPYQEEFKKLRQDGGHDGAKTDSKEEPKENLKPSDQNKIYYEYNQNYAEKNDGDMKINDDLSMNIRGEYACYKCNEIFPSKRGLKQHSKACVESGENTEKVGKFGCTQCAYRCQSPAILKIHERTHSGEKPFSCTFCDYKSGQKNNVAKHILVHMKEKPFRCQYCDYRCAQKNNLVVHERTHTGYKPFACPYCEYRTVQKPNLVKHMYLHTDQKPFSCDMCTYRCVQKTNLTKHKQRHLNEKDGEKVEVKSQVKPYRPRQKSVKCTQCAYRCVQKSSLEKHMQFKHGGVEDYPEDGLVHEDNDTIQNLSVKKDDAFADGCHEKEPLQIQS